MHELDNTRTIQSIFVDEARHNRVSLMVKNALDGRGSIEGFFEFVEDKVFSKFGTPTGIGPTEAEEAMSPAFVKLRAYSLEEIVNHTDDYLEVWEQVTQETGWFDDNPVAAHLMALVYPTTRASALLQVPRQAFSNRQPSRFSEDTIERSEYLSIVDRLRAHASLNVAHEYIYTLGTSGLYTSKKHNHKPGWQWKTPVQSPYFDVFPVWHEDQIDLLLKTSQLRAVDILVDGAAHAFFLNLVSNAFFQRCEYVFDYVFNDKGNWIDIEPEAKFMEHGVAMFDIEKASWDAEEVRQDTQSYFEHWGEGEPTTDNILSTALDLPAWGDDDVQERWLMSVSGSYLTSLRLAQRLGLLSFDKDGLDDVKSAIAERFLSHNGLPAALPEREHAYTILRNRHRAAIYEGMEYGGYRSAVDYHLFELFRLYAASVMPEAEPVRVVRPVLATLAQPWLFETKGLLEVFSGHQVKKTETGSWQFYNGTATVLEIGNLDAYNVAQCLKEIAQFYAREYDTMTMVGTVSELEDRQRLTLPTGIPLIERALEKLGAHSEALDAELTTLEEVGRDICSDLIDEVLGGQGQIKRALCARWKVHSHLEAA